MSDFEYRVIVAPAVAKKVRGAKTLAERFAHGLSELINAEAREGWDYFARERFQVEGKSGLLGKSRTTEETFLIFRRAKNSLAAIPLDKRLETMVELRARKKTVENPVPVQEYPIETVVPVPAPSAAAAFAHAVDTAESAPNSARHLERAEPSMQADDDKPSEKSGNIFTPLTTLDPDADEKHAPRNGPAGRD